MIKPQHNIICASFSCPFDSGCLGCFSLFSHTFILQSIIGKDKSRFGINDNWYKNNYKVAFPSNCEQDSYSFQTPSVLCQKSRSRRIIVEWPRYDAMKNRNIARQICCFHNFAFRLALRPWTQPCFIVQGCRDVFSNFSNKLLTWQLMLLDISLHSEFFSIHAVLILIAVDYELMNFCRI